MHTDNLFGTDGIRGKANQYPITAEIALKLGMSIGTIFKDKTHHNSVILGKDTRLSGYMLESALQAGIISTGMNVILVGPLPSAAVAMLTISLKATLGIMITASHNSYVDNGIKIFGHTGSKISKDQEQQISSIIRSEEFSLADGTNLGKAQRLEDARGRYIEFAKNSKKHTQLSGMKIVIDCANGAAYTVAQHIFQELDANVITINNNPNGFNINENCGSENISGLQAAVIQNNADVGISFDGDADRLVMCDENGKLISGEQILASLVQISLANNELSSPVVVSTVLASKALEHHLSTHGLQLIRTPVGDRNITSAMLKHNSNIGGEPSGHFIMRDSIMTGDGIVSAVHILNALKKSNKPASDFLNIFKPSPIIQKNIYGISLANCQDKLVQNSIAHAEDSLKKTKGRMVLRESGTEHCIRILIEGEEESMIQSLMNNIVDSIYTVNKLSYVE